MDIFIMIIFLFLGIFFAGLCKLKTGIYLNFGSVFTIIWGVTGALANTGFYGIYLPSELVNISMLAGIIIFGFIYLGGAKREVFGAADILEMNSFVRTRFLVISNIVALAFVLPYFYTALSIIWTKGFVYLRAVNYTGYDITGRSTIINLLLQNICYPLFLVTLIISMISLLIGKKNAVKLFILSLINIVIYEIMNGARSGLVTIIVILVIAFFKIRFPLMKERIQSISKGKKRAICLAMIALLWLVIAITNERTLGQKSLFENFYYYYFAGPSYLSQLLNHLQNYTLNSTLFWGTATFGFIYNIFATFLNLIGINAFNSIHTMNSVLSSVYFSVSNTSKINAIATVYFPFLMDYGYAGLVIGPIIIAMMSLYISKRNIGTNSIRWHSIQIYWFYIIYRTVFKWELISMSAFFVFFYIFVFTRQKTKG